MGRQPATTNPLEQEAKPEFPEQTQASPGLEAEMEPKPDYGEQSYRGSGKLEGRAAIVTGGDSGIGRAVALAFAREGADVLISYFNEEPDAQETARVVREAGRKAVTVPGDITNEDHCRSLVERAVQEFGHLDILVNNAAYQKNYGSIEEIPTDEWDHTFRTNIYAMFWISKAALPHMKSGATIINTASVQAYKPSSSLMAYATTKAAIVAFTKALATEVIERGIRVNAVAPGPVWTPFIVSSTDPKSASQFGAESLIKRPAQPAELAPAYVYLASEDSSYVIGEVIGVTGDG